MGGTNKPDLLKDLSREDLLAAIELAGYPFEVRLFHQLRKGGLDPVLGFQCQVDEEGERQEIDLLASAFTRVTVPGVALQVEQKAFIQVKKLQEPKRFIGVLGQRPSDHELRVNRTRAPGGRPCWELIRGVPDEGLTQLLHGPGGFGECFDAFLGAPQCVHWGIAHRNKEGEPRAEGDSTYWKAISSSVKAGYWLAREMSEFHLNVGNHSPNQLRMRFSFPTLIVDTPALLLYDPDTKGLTEVDWLVYNALFDLGSGRLAYSPVDIVTGRGVEAMIERYRATAAALQPVLERHLPALVRVADAQQRWWAEKGLQKG